MHIAVLFSLRLLSRTFKTRARAGARAKEQETEMHRGLVEDKDAANNLKFQIQKQLIETKSTEL